MKGINNEDENDENKDERNRIQLDLQEIGQHYDLIRFERMEDILEIVWRSSKETLPKKHNFTRHSIKQLHGPCFVH